MANITISGLTGKTAVATDEIEVQATGGGASNKVTALSLMGVASPTLTTPLLGTPTSGTLTNCTGLPAAGVVGTAAVLGANTFTALQTITQASANAGILASTGYSLTGSDATGMVNLAGTWNTSGTPSAVTVNITDTASNSASAFLDFKLAGTRRFAVLKNGRVNFYSNADVGSIQTDDSNFGVIISSTTLQDYWFSGTSFRVSASRSLGWTAGTSAVAGLDLILSRSAAGSVTISDNANGKSLGIKMLTELTTIAAAATTTTAIQKPANSIILGVSVRNTVALPITSTYTVGDSGSATRFSTAAVSKAVNSTDPGTKAGAYYNATAEGIIITPDTTPSDATGRVRVTIHYIDVTPPTS